MSNSIDNQTETADGLVRCEYTLPDGYDKYLEYTFFANDKTWLGVCKTVQKYKIPCKCTVKYDPNDPVNNSIGDIILES